MWLWLKKEPRLLFHEYHDNYIANQINSTKGNNL